MSNDAASGSSYIELAYSSIRIFADDGTVDMAELNFLLGLALKDGRIDDDERRVLGKIFDQAAKTDLSMAVRARIREVRKKHSI
ncbi:MAG: hypothetical protein AAGC60_00640 [Acidobacteriota bacterium]